MTQQEIDQAVKYLKDPNRNTFIEAEMPSNKEVTFGRRYSSSTNNYPLPADNDKTPYYVWPDGTNKWNVELRIYFNADENIPTFLNDLCTTCTRKGYEEFGRRLNNNELIYNLFERGFILGNQILSRII